MKLSLSAPVAAPAVASVSLQASVYDFAADAIVVTWLELDAAGNVLQQRTQTLSHAQVAAFFSTPVSTAPDLRTVFVQAFITAVTNLYAQTVTLVG